MARPRRSCGIPKGCQTAKRSGCRSERKKISRCKHTEYNRSRNQRGRVTHCVRQGLGRCQRVVCKRTCKKAGCGTRRIAFCQRPRCSRRCQQFKYGKRCLLRRCQSSEFQIPLIAPRSLLDIKFDTYIKKIQRKARPKIGLKRESVKLIDNLMKDILHQLACLASSKMGRRKTLKPKMILRALRKVMPKSLVDRVHAHAQNVLNRYSRNSRCRK